jgi:hypothetical protein
VPKHTSAICVQSFDDSLNSAIHITYRISLRSSSLREPRYPLLRVLDRFDFASICVVKHTTRPHTIVHKQKSLVVDAVVTPLSAYVQMRKHIHTPRNIDISQGLVWIHDNDPSAGSPTETLLRLLLPLDDRVCVTSRSKTRLPELEPQSERLTRPSNR